MIETSIYVLINSIILISVHFIYKKIKINSVIDSIMALFLGVLMAEYLRPILGMTSFFIGSQNIYYLEYINIVLLLVFIVYAFKFISRDTEDYSRFK